MMKRKFENTILLTPEGSRLLERMKTARSSSFPRGCGIGTVTEVDLQALRSLFHHIRAGVKETVPWGEGMVDRKARCYGLVRGTNWGSTESILKSGISMSTPVENMVEAAGVVDLQALNKHEYTMDNSFVEVLLTDEWKAAVENVILETQRIIKKEAPFIEVYERESVSFNNLVAIQPNIHNGEAYLPLHLDSPRHDGFGIVIATVELYGSADIILVDDGDEGSTNPSISWKFSMNPGQLYVLSGPSRNLCAHGLIVTGTAAVSEMAELKLQNCVQNQQNSQGKRRKRNKTRKIQKNENSDRISLNFRFGIHSAEQAQEQIDKHWT